MLYEGGETNKARLQPQTQPQARCATGETETEIVIFVVLLLVAVNVATATANAILFTKRVRLHGAYDNRSQTLIPIT